MTRVFLPPDAPFRLHSPPEGVGLVLRDAGQVTLSGALPWASCRYHDAVVGIDFPLATNRQGRPYYDRDWGPFLGMQGNDLGMVLRSFRHGVSPLVRSKEHGHNVPFLVCLLEAERWSDSHLATVMVEAQRSVDLAAVEHQGRSLLDRALLADRFRLADHLWEHGVRFSPSFLQQGGPVWATLLASFASWAMAQGHKGCSSPATSAKVYQRMTQAAAYTISHGMVPVLRRWLDRAVNEGANVQVQRTLNYQDEEKDGDATRALTTSPMGLVLFQASRNLLAVKDQGWFAQHLVEPLLRAGAAVNVPMTWDGGATVMGLADYAQQHGLHEAAAMIERVALAPLVPTTGTMGGHGRRRL